MIKLLRYTCIIIFSFLFRLQTCFIICSYTIYIYFFFFFSLMLDPSACKFLSLNVRGLKNKKKRSSVFTYLKDQKCHFYLLQETYSEPKDEIVWRSEWEGKILYLHGTNWKKGVCILISPQFNDFQIEYSCSDAEGRLILANVSINSFQISLCNIYAPNNLQMQNTFVRDLSQFKITP